MSQFLFKPFLPADFSNDSRVWIYQGNRQFNPAEALDIERLLSSFTFQWQSHGTPVKGYGHLFFGQFIVLMADETASGVSGCSTDSSVRLMKEIEEKCAVTLFDRQLLSFVIDDKIALLPLSQLTNAFDQGLISSDTIYFNNLVQTKKELEQNWLIPIKDSWLVKKIPSISSH